MTMICFCPDLNENNEFRRLVFFFCYSNFVDLCNSYTLEESTSLKWRYDLLRIFWCTHFSKVTKMSQTSDCIFEKVTIVFNVYGDGDKF
jgi:hypothetical protein